MNCLELEERGAAKKEKGERKVCMEVTEIFTKRRKIKWGVGGGGGGSSDEVKANKG